MKREEKGGKKETEKVQDSRKKKRKHRKQNRQRPQENKDIENLDTFWKNGTMSGKKRGL